MESWYIIRSDVVKYRYYLYTLTNKKDIGIYQWVPNRYSAMFFYTAFSVGGYITTYMTPVRSDIDLDIICFKNGEEEAKYALPEFRRIYTKVLHQAIIT